MRKVCLSSKLFAKELISRLILTFQSLFGCGRSALSARPNLQCVSILLLITCLLTTSTPAAPQVMAGVATKWQQDAHFWFRSSGWEASMLGLIRGQERPQQKRQEKQAERDARISRIRIHPGDMTITVGERVFFAAVAYDQNDVPLNGVNFTWQCLEEGRNLKARVSPEGEFVATTTGNFKIMVEGAGRTAHVRVKVDEGARLKANDQPTGPSKKVSTRDLPKATASLTSKEEKPFTAHATKRTALTAAAMPLPLEGWSETNYESADDPSNRVGDTPGGTIDGGAGSGNFQITAPVIDLPGRGLDVSLALAYNSRVWNKSSSEMTYDIDRGWPAPGWNLGFSKVLGMGVWAGSMLVESDGTRHSYVGTVTPYDWGTTFVGHTVDGSFIDYSHRTGIGGAINYAEARYPNGTTIIYGAAGEGAMYPTEITDANGNYIRITYNNQNNTGPQIATITDTLGRSIIFHYDAYNLLTAITGPDLDGGTRTLVRLQYRQLPLDYGFSGLTARVRNTAPWVVNAIYYPATGSGYWFGDTDPGSPSYSSYGMIAKVVEQRGMSFSASSLDEQGTITPGVMTHQIVYNYDLLPNFALTDAPTYTTQTNTWEMMDVAAQVTTYSAQPDASPRRVEMTRPDGVKNVQLSYNYSHLAEGHPDKFRDGLVYQDETYNADGALIGSSSTLWEQGAYDSPRPTRVEVTDDRSQKTVAEFGYGPVYNQVTEVRDYDYGSQALLRKTKSEYENSTSYTGRHIFNLIKWVEVYGSDDVTRLARTEYEYDNGTLADTPGVVQHKEGYNPHAPTVENCDWRPKPSNPDIEIYICEDYNPYIPATAYRGNVTSVTSYAEAVGLGGKFTETRNYDRTGNLITTSTSCCEQTSITYTSNTKYAYPESVTRGSASAAAARETTSDTYDFNTGLMLVSTNANGNTSQTNYFSGTLRPKEDIASTGAKIVYGYDDVGLKITETIFASAAEGSAIASQTEKYLNGLGQVRHEKALGVNNVWDVVDTKYDGFGRVWKQTRPYRAGDTPQWNETLYDALGRVITMKGSDGSETKAFYNETDYPSSATQNVPGQTSRMVDAWGRERWGRTDASGRLVEVVEPKPEGNGRVSEAGNLLTQYIYDGLGRLTGVIQGDQQRRFKYDSLGRLTHQKLAERAATLDDQGQYVGASGQWSDYFIYDSRSNMLSRTDARGVKTNFSYKDASGNDDPLNRLFSVSYDVSGDPLQSDAFKKVLPSATVTYEYMTSGGVTRLRKATTNGVSTEEYEYDSEGRVKGRTMTLASRPSYQMSTNYIYDSLDRITDIRYPVQYGSPNAPRKLVHYTHDIASRISGTNVDGVSYASEIEYNAASQIKSLKVGTSGANQITESYNYDTTTGLLSNQIVARGTGTSATKLLDLSYDYLRDGTTGGRTGQLTRITNNLDATRAKDRTYKYDALGRLVEATGGPASAPVWTQSYVYDRYGNRKSVTATSNVASITTPVVPQAKLPTEQLASNFDVQTMETAHSNTMGGISDSPFTPFSSARTTTSRASVSPSSTPQASSSIVISQIYGGGGNTGAIYKNDFIELFNRGNTTVNLTGWSVQYAASGSSIWQMTTLSGSLAPGQYYLVKQAQGAGGTTDLPAPNATDNVELNATAGKVALVNNSSALTGACPLSGSGVLDFIGYGSSSGCFEGSSAAPAPSNTTAISRASQGCIDTNNNVTDFDSSAATPRNSNSPAGSCGGGAPGSTTVVISEFRTRGAAGGNDEFLELYNKSDSPINIGGWKIKVSNNTGVVSTRVVISANTMLPAHGHFLAASTGTGGYSGMVVADQTYAIGITDDGGIAITRADDTIVDQVGMSNGSAFKENRSLSPLTGNTDRSFERKAGGANGSTQDINDNPSDFQARTPSDPQNLQGTPTPQTPVNQPPVANAGGPYSQTSGASVDFNGSNSTDTDGTITAFQWNFGDNTTGTGATPQHIYTSAGTYTAVLTVTDNQGAQASANVNVNITAGGATGCASAQSIPVEQFVTNFYQGALDRQPTAAELQSGISILSQSYYQGQAQLMQAAQNMGRQLFTSNEYIGRNRSDRDYVYDLYKAYLHRGPDQPGWDHWTQVAAVNGRDAVRWGFDFSPEFSQVVATICAQGTSGGGSVPADGYAALSYDEQTNRITSAGFSYDAAGNQTRVLNIDGTAQRYQYDAANRLIYVRADDQSIINHYTYGSSNSRLAMEEAGLRTYYVSDGMTVLMEYAEGSQESAPRWAKNYIYVSGRLLATQQPGGVGEVVQYHHPDRLGTRVVTNSSDTTHFEQVGLPFGAALEAESTGATNRRFTSYDRSNITGLDYAVNRHYDSQQGRFTQVDPIGMASVNLSSPQTLNMYAYCGNDPINRVDPSGLFWGKLWRAISKILTNKWVRIALAVAVAVLSLNPSSLIIVNFTTTGAATLSLSTTGYIASGLMTALSVGSVLPTQESKPAQQEERKVPPGYEIKDGVLTKTDDPLGAVISASVAVVALPEVVAGGVAASEVLAIAALAVLTLAGVAISVGTILEHWRFPASTASRRNDSTNANTSSSTRDRTNTSGNANRRYGNKWSCFAKGANINIATNSAEGYVTGAGHAMTRLDAALAAKKNAANNTLPGFRAKHVKVMFCRKRF